MNALIYLKNRMATGFSQLLTIVADLSVIVFLRQSVIPGFRPDAPLVGVLAANEILTRFQHFTPADCFLKGRR